jgi:endonuclease YncB( thermonuclease family)
MNLRWLAHILICLMLLSTAALGDHLKGEAVQGKAKVLSGSVLSINKKTVALFGIHGISMQTLPWGPRARAALMRLADGKKVHCKLESHANQSEIAKCKIGKVDLAKALVRAGLASADRTQSDDYLAAERAAKKAGAGFWK